MNVREASALEPFTVARYLHAMRPPAMFAIALAVALALAVLGTIATLQPGGILIGFGAGAMVVAILLPRRLRDDGGGHVPRAQMRIEATLGMALDAIDDPLLLTEDGRIARTNAAARRLFGPRVEDEDIRLAIRHPTAARLIAEATPDEPATAMLDAVGSDARRYEMRVTVLPDGRRLVRLSDRSTAEVAEKMRTDFVANASHELRTPLATLIGFIETLEDANAAEDAPTRARFLKIMMGEAKRMQQLVDDLVSLSRIEGERFSAPAAPISLGPLAAEVRAAILTAQRLPPERIVVEAMVETPVAGDRNQLAQVLHNLIGNALKYGRAGAPVIVRVKPSTAGRIAVSVTDQGDGIAPEHLPRLTERFYRVDPGRSRALGGTGLGLAIVKHIVERHRGRLSVESQQGIGTTVTILLPAVG